MRGVAMGGTGWRGAGAVPAGASIGERGIMTTLMASRVEPGRVLAETDRGKKAAMMQYLAQKFRVDVFDILTRGGRGTGAGRPRWRRS